MLIDNALHFTIQTSPPDEPDELFHKELPSAIRRCRRRQKEQTVAATLANCDTNLDYDNEIEYVCDNECGDMSILTKGLSWLRLNLKNGIQAATNQVEADATAAAVATANSSLDITNPNSAIFSETNDSSGFSPLSAGGIPTKPNLKRRFSPSLVESPRNIVLSVANEEDVKSKRRCVLFSEHSFTLNTPPDSSAARSEQSSGITSIDLDKPSTLKRQKVIRRKSRKLDTATVPQSIYNKNLKSWLTLPNGIPSPFEVHEKQFRILSCTPMTAASAARCNVSSVYEEEFNVMKKAVSTPKPEYVLDLTEDIFLSPGIRPLLDSVMMQNSCVENNDETSSKSHVGSSPVSNEQTWNSHRKHFPAETTCFTENDVNCSMSSVQSTSVQSTNSSRINDDQDVLSSISK